MALSDKDFQRLKNKLLQQKEQQVTQQRKKRPFLSRAAEFVGATKLVELAAPAAELFALGGSFLQGESGRRFRQERLLGRPLGEASRVAEEEGLGAGFKVIGGQALETAARASVFTRGGLGTTLIGKGLEGNKLLNFANSFVGRSAEIAFFKSVGEDLQDDTPFGKLFKDASVNALSSAAISFLLGSLGEKILNRFKTSATRLTGRALDPSIKQLQGDIERGRATLNTRIVKEGYAGTAIQIRNKAANNLDKFGNQIDDIVTSAKGNINKKDVIIAFDKLFNENVTLDPSQLNLIIKQIDKIPETMTVAQANQFKKQFAKLVPQSAWDVTATQSDTFRAQLFKAASGGFRKEIEKIVPSIKIVNEKWSIALDVLSLASKQLAKREIVGGVAERVQSGLFRLASETIASPFTATVTRTIRAQILNALAKAGNKQLVREVAKLLIIKAEGRK